MYKYRPQNNDVRFNSAWDDRDISPTGGYTDHWGSNRVLRTRLLDGDGAWRDKGASSLVGGVPTSTPTEVKSGGRGEG